MWKKIDAETKLGGVFGIIAVIAICVQMAVSGFTADAVWGGIKDVAATMVAVMVLIVAVSRLKPKKEPTTFAYTLHKELHELEDRFEPLFSKGEKEGHENVIRYNLLTDFTSVFSCQNGTEEKKATTLSKSSHLAGRFFDFATDENTKAAFYVNKTTFGSGMSAEDWKEKAPNLSERFVSCIGRKFQGFCKAKKNKDGDTINITFLKEHGLNSSEDAQMLTKLVEFMIVLYIIEFNKDI